MNAFNTMEYGELEVRKFKNINEIENNEYNLFRGWIEDGIFDALKRGYLNEVIFTIFQFNIETNKKEALEEYKFKVKKMRNGSYQTEMLINDKKSSKRITKTKNDVVTQSVAVIKTLIQLNGVLKPVPKNRELVM